MGVRHLGDARQLEREKARKSRQAAKASPLASSSVTRGGVRIESAEGIRVNTVPGGAAGLRVSGLQLVDGVLRITGSIEGLGEFVWEGPWSLDGDGDIAGAVNITGVLTLLSDLLVNSGGRIKVGANVVLDPASGGRIVVGGADGDTVLSNSMLQFANGSQIKANSGGTGAAVTGGGYAMSVQTGIAAIGTTGKRFEVDGFYAGPRIVGMPTVTELTADSMYRVVADANGVLYRVV